MKRNTMNKKDDMLPEYDFSNSVKNPYVKLLKKTVTIRLEENIIEYFKELALQFNIPYQSLINMYLSDCAKNKVKPSINWIKSEKKKVS